MLTAATRFVQQMWSLLATTDTNTFRADASYEHQPFCLSACFFARV